MQRRAQRSIATAEIGQDESGTGFASVAPVPDATRLRVLIVDDEDRVRELVIDHLTIEGYDVEGASDAMAGLAAARERPPAVVLLDLNLPGAASGFDLLGAFAREAPVVVLSGMRDNDLARAALRQGAFDYVTKPFALTRLSAVTAAAIMQGRSGRIQM